MRTKKDPGIRQELFIKAATQLFIEKGYDDVSVRDVLDAVADKSASPSVFYYYFASKDALYRACIEGIAERYVAGFREQFSREHSTREEWMLSHVAYLTDYLTGYLASERNIMMTGSSERSHMFILDMRAKVTQQVAALWTDSLEKGSVFSRADARKLSQFLSGGISEMIYNYMLEEKKGIESARELVRDIVRFSANTIGASEEQKKLLEKTMEEHFSRN